MHITPFKKAALALAIPGMMLAVPAAAASAVHQSPTTMNAEYAPLQASSTYEHKRKRERRYERHDYGRYDSNYGNYAQPVYRDTRIWRGRDGRYYCQKENGTTGLLIGAAVGGLVGNEVAGRGDRTLGAILGAAGGAILGRAIDRSNSQCR